MNQSTYQAQLADVARWCQNKYRGILTPKKRIQVTIPTYLILKCDRCDGLSMQKKRLKAGPRPCTLRKYSQEKTKSTSAPHTRVCEGHVRVIEEINP